MFCGYCGKQVQDGTAFCPYCGCKMEPVAPLPEEQYVQQPGQVNDQQAYAQYGQYGQQYGQDYDQQAYAQYDQYGQQYGQGYDQQAYAQYDQYGQQYGQGYDQQAYAQYDQYGQQYTQYDQQYAQYDQQYVYPSYSAAAAVKTPEAVVPGRERKWPVACGVMGIIALVMLLIGNVLPLAFDSYTGFNFFNAMIPAMMIAVFFIPTKRIAWVTIFPFLIYVGIEIYAQITSIRQLLSLFGQSWAVTSEVLYLAIPIILFVLYALNMIIRPEGSALKVLFLIFMIIEIILLLIASFSLIYSGVTYSSGSYILSPLFARLAFIFFYIGHGVAVLSVHGR